MVSAQQVQINFQKLKGTHNTNVADGVTDWPTGELLYKRYDKALKPKLLNVIMPLCPAEVNDITKLPSGKGLLEYIKIQRKPSLFLLQQKQ